MTCGRIFSVWRLTHASSLDSKAPLILISHAASQDLDLWALDVSTAFLYGKFPEGTHQYARRPHGVPGDFFPPVLELGSCVYGHPAASQRLELHNQGKGCTTKLGSNAFGPLRLFFRFLHLQRRILLSRVLSLMTARLLINLDLQ